MKKYIAAVRRRLNLPKEIKDRVMTDFATTVSAMQESGKSDEEIQAELGTPKKVAADLNEQMKEFAYRKSPWRFVFLAGAVLSGLWLAGMELVSRLFLKLTGASLIWSTSENSSTGIIGGADGPTAIFVTTATTTGVDWDTILVVAMLVICTLAFLRLRRCKPKQ